MPTVPRLLSIKIDGFRPFRNFEAELGPLEVLVGANGSGKSSLFEFLRFLRDGMTSSLPPQIVPGPSVRTVFHVPGPELLRWDVRMMLGKQSIAYDGELAGPVGKPQVVSERILDAQGEEMMRAEQGAATIAQAGADPDRRQRTKIGTGRNRLALGMVVSPEYGAVSTLREVVSEWRFYSGLRIADEKIRKPVLVEQEPALEEDAGNLSAVLHYMLTEHRSRFEELEQHLRSAVPGFRSLRVRALGAPGQVMGFWEEDGVNDKGLVLSDLSDGILRLICWITLCVHPNPPPLICIDEPDQGVHPRTLPVLAGLFKKASERTQFILATHSSYFLTQFDLSSIAVMRKENGEARFIKPGDSAVLKGILEDFGPEEIEALHVTDELERLP